MKAADEPPSFDEVFVIVEDMPVFPDNSDKSLKRTFSDFRDYIKSETYYPLMARKRKIQTSVFVQFTIGPDGKIYDIVIPKPKYDLLDYEAARVIRNSPRWIPGRQKGKAVAVRMNTSVSFYQ
ncbi:MAG: energy transducer TonB [Chlorobi bacterium]|nr:energy transducer TonB [Chlorobiota bacterium]